MNLNLMFMYLLTAAPLTGDEGMAPILIIAVVGAVLAVAFYALTAVQKKRRENADDDGE